MFQKTVYILATLLLVIGLLYSFYNHRTKNNENKSVSSDLFDSRIKNNTLAVSPKEDIVIVGKSDSKKIIVYDLKTKKKIKELSGFLTPRHIAFSKDNSSFFVSDSSLGSIQEFDIMTFDLIKNYSMKKGVFGFTFTKDGETIAATNQAENSVTLLDLNTQKKEIIPDFSGPREDILIDSTDNYAYVTNYQTNDVRVLDLTAKKIVNVFENIPKIRGIALDETNNLLYGVASSENSIHVLDSTTGKQLNKIPVGEEPNSCILVSDKNLLLTSEKENTQVSVIDLTKNQVVRTIKGLKPSRQATGFSQIGDYAYLLNDDLSVTIIDYQKGTVVENIK